MATVNVEIVAIGSELLLGQIVDTNSAWMAQRLAGIGVNLFYKTIVGDNAGRIPRGRRKISPLARPTWRWPTPMAFTPESTTLPAVVILI